MFASQKQRNKQVGLYITADGIAVAEVDIHKDQKPELKSCEYFPATETSEQLKQLETYIRRRDLKKQDCIVALDDTRYGLFQIPAPKVEDKELQSAVRWSVKDLIDYPLEQAVIDVFRIPVEGNREAKVYAVVAQHSEIQQTVDFVNNTGLTLNAIDIEELSLGNIIEQLEGHERGVAVLHVGPQLGSISLYRDSVLYLSRRIDIGLEQMMSLQEQNVDAETMAAQIYEPIILELQRSLDFYEHELAQPPVSRLMVAPRHPLLQQFSDYVSSQTRLGVEFLNLGNVFTDATELTDDRQSHCLLAIAAASRQVGIAA